MPFNCFGFRHNPWPAIDQGWQGLAPGRRQRGSRTGQSAARAALLLLPLALYGCSGIAMPNEEMPAGGPGAGFNTAVAERIKTFPDYETYDAFEISDLRWVHTTKGWNWLACVRFQDKGRARTYAVFIKDDKVVDGRFAVEIDACGLRNYSPFPLLGSAQKPAAGTLEPVH